MMPAVMPVAKQRQIVRGVTAASFARHDVMDFEIARRATARHAARATIAAVHEPHDLRRYVLGRALIRSDALRVALGAFKIGRVERLFRARALLPSDAAGVAARDHDLVLRSPRVTCRRARERGIAQRRDQCIVVESVTAFVLDHLLRLPQQRQRRRSNIEADRLRDELWIGRIARPVTTLAACHGLLDLAQVLAAGFIEPGLLGRSRRDACELADGAEMQLAVRERVGELRQIFERGGHAYSLGRLARRIAERVFNIFVQRCAAELAPDLAAHSASEQLGFVGVERASSLRERAQLAIDLPPLARCRRTTPLVRNRRTLAQHACPSGECSVLSRDFWASLRRFSTRNRRFAENSRSLTKSFTTARVERSRRGSTRVRQPGARSLATSVKRIRIPLEKKKRGQRARAVCDAVRA